MPRGTKIKVKKIMPKGSVEDANVLNDMFEQMTGSQNADSSILIPKIIELNELLIKFCKVYTMLLNFNDFIDNFQEHKTEFDEIKRFIDDIQKIITPETEMSETKLKQLNDTQINSLYKELKSKSEVQTIVIASSNLKKYKRYLEDKNNLKDDFIKREPGLSMTPLSFTKLDFKLLWASNKLTNMAKKYILSILNHTFIIGHSIYEVITSPDIDIKKFSKVLIENIDKMKKTIPRCDKAFNIIKNSVSLLEDNFKSYYKNSVESENPSVIVESFIIDVSMSQKANASITGQFRRIIMFMKKQAANNNDPRVKKLFKILNSQFDLMAQKTGVTPVDDDDIPNIVPENNIENTNEEVKDEETEALEEVLTGMMEHLGDNHIDEGNDTDSSLPDLEDVSKEPDVDD